MQSLHSRDDSLFSRFRELLESPPHTYKRQTVGSAKEVEDMYRLLQAMKTRQSLNKGDDELAFLNPLDNVTEKEYDLPAFLKG